MLLTLNQLFYSFILTMFEIHQMSQRSWFILVEHTFISCQINIHDFLTIYTWQIGISRHAAPTFFKSNDSFSCYCYWILQHFTIAGQCYFCNASARWVTSRFCTHRAWLPMILRSWMVNWTNARKNIKSINVDSAFSRSFVVTVKLFFLGNSTMRRFTKPKFRV